MRGPGGGIVLLRSSKSLVPSTASESAADQLRGTQISIYLHISARALSADEGVVDTGSAFSGLLGGSSFCSGGPCGVLAESCDAEGCELRGLILL